MSLRQPLNSILRWPPIWQGLWLSLNLRGNKIGAAGGRAIAAALAPSALLQRLDLADTDQTVDSLIALRTAVEAGASLTHLILDRPLNPSHGEESATHMSALVARAPCLSVLSLQKVRGRGCSPVQPPGNSPGRHHSPPPPPVASLA